MSEVLAEDGIAIAQPTAEWTGQQLREAFPFNQLPRYLSGRELYFLSYSPPMLIFLTTLLGTLSSIFCSRAVLGLENLALPHRIGVLQPSARKRPKLTPADRLLWVWLSRTWRDWRSVLAIVKPETVVAWHRVGFRRVWTWKVRRGQPGRPAISREVRDLIRQMCRENPGWAASLHRAGDWFH